MLVLASLFSFLGMTVASSFCSGVVKSLDIMNEGHISLYEFPAGIHIILFKILFLHDLFKFFVKALMYFVCENFIEGFQFAIGNRLVCSGNGRAKVTASRFNTRVRFSFPSPVNTNKGFKEIHVCKFLCLWIELPHSQGFLESISYFGLIFLWIPRSEQD